MPRYKVIGVEGMFPDGCMGRPQRGWVPHMRVWADGTQLLRFESDPPRCTLGDVVTPLERARTCKITAHSEYRETSDEPVRDWECLAVIADAEGQVLLELEAGSPFLESGLALIGTAWKWQMETVRTGT